MARQVFDGATAAAAAIRWAMTVSLPSSRAPGLALLLHETCRQRKRWRKSSPKSHARSFIVTCAPLSSLSLAAALFAGELQCEAHRFSRHRICKGNTDETQPRLRVRERMRVRSRERSSQLIHCPTRLLLHSWPVPAILSLTGSQL